MGRQTQGIKMQRPWNTKSEAAKEIETETETDTDTETERQRDWTNGGS